MSSWIGWLTKPRSTTDNDKTEEGSSKPSTLEDTSAVASSSTDSPTKARMYPSLSATPGSPSAPPLSEVIRDDWVNETTTESTSSSKVEKKLSEKELTRIKEENERLKSVLQQIQLKQTPSPSSGTAAPSAPLSSSYNFQHVGHIPGGNGFLVSIPSLSSSTASNPLASSAAAAASASASAGAPPSYSSILHNKDKTKELKEKGKEKGKEKEKGKSDDVICHGDHSTVVIKQVKEDDNDKENAVALLDLNEMDWWVMVNGTEGKDKPSSASSSSTLTSVEVDDDDCVHREGGLRIVKSHLSYDDEGYVLIDENDFIQALSDFISQSIARQYPEAERIPPQELQGVLRQAFLPIRQPSRFGKAYSWAQFLYQSYSWGNCAWSLYREPFYVKLVLRGAMKAAQWLLVLVI